VEGGVGLDGVGGGHFGRGGRGRRGLYSGRRPSPDRDDLRGRCGRDRGRDQPTSERARRQWKQEFPYLTKHFGRISPQTSGKSPISITPLG